MTNYHFLNLTKPWLCHNVNNSPLDSGAVKVEHHGLKLKGTDQLLSLDWERMCTVFTAVNWPFIVFFHPDFLSPHITSCPVSVQYGLKKKEEKEAEEKAAMEQACEGSLTRPKKAIPRGCGDDDEEDEESILDTVLKFLPGPLQDMFKK